MARIAYDGSMSAFPFALGGRRVLVAAAATVMPTTIVTLDNTNLPAGYVDLGATENSDVTISLTRQTESISTGVIPTERRKYIVSQEGSMEAVFMRYEPTLIGYQGGVSVGAVVPASGGSQAYRDIYLGGTLGSVVTVLCFEDFDIPQVIDAGTEEYDQVWHYSPNAQPEGDINLSQRVQKAFAVPIRFALLGYTVAGVDRSVLLTQRWIQTVP